MTANRLHDPLESAPPLDQIEAFIDWARDFRGPESLKARQGAEDRARELLDRSAGALTREQALELGRLLSTDARRGELRYDRFSPAFHGATWERVLESFDVFDEFVARLWRGSEPEALRATGELIDNPRALPGAGRALPTVLLYLRDPEKYAVWLSAMVRGLRVLAGTPRIRRSQGLDGYRTFCEAAQEFAGARGLAPPEVDGVLALAGRVARRRARGERGTPAPLLGRSAFTFLADLAKHSRAEWMTANRGRYRDSLAQPFRALMRDVAERYIDDLDPELNTEIKTGQVLASIRRRLPDGKREYYDYYWGAFSRKRKHEDAQLYVMVRSSQLEAGVTFGTAAEDQLARMRARAKEYAAEVWSAIAPMAADLVFLPSSDSPKAMRVTSSVELVECLEGERPRIFRRWSPDDARVGTPELADAVGSALETLYPIAALSWMEEHPVLKIDEGPEPAPELDEYDIGELARETLLPIEDLEEWISLLRGPKRQALFYGPPGTGKTEVARAIARHLVTRGGRVELVQFHPSFTYEDFVEGPRPSKGGGSAPYEIRSGIFCDFCEAARRKPDQTFVMIIDEINRADLDSVLGELLTLFEYRGERIALPYSKRPFGVPKNIVILATMGTVHRGRAALDVALRRRFHAIELPPSRDVLARFLPPDDDADLALRLFDLVQEEVGSRELAPGHTYFMQGDPSAEGLGRVWRYELRPYLAELWFDQPDRLRRLERAVYELLGEGA